MIDDPIVEEIRRAREAHAAKFNYDMAAICRDIREQQRQSGRKYASYPSRRLADESPMPADAHPILSADSATDGSVIGDPIVDEIRRIRDEHAKKFNYDLKAIYEDIKRQERESGLTYVSYPPRLIGSTDDDESETGPSPIPFVAPLDNSAVPSPERLPSDIP